MRLETCPVLYAEASAASVARRKPATPDLVQGFWDHRRSAIGGRAGDGVSVTLTVCRVLRTRGRCDPARVPRRAEVFFPVLHDVAQPSRPSMISRCGLPPSGMVWCFMSTHGCRVYKFFAGEWCQAPAEVEQRACVKIAGSGAWVSRRKLIRRSPVPPLGRCLPISS